MRPHGAFTIKQESRTWIKSKRVSRVKERGPRACEYAHGPFFMSFNTLLATTFLTPSHIPVWFSLASSCSREYSWGSLLMRKNLRKG